MSDRAIDHAWEALVEVTGVNPETGRGELNFALGQIRSVSQHLEDAELAIVIRHRARLYHDMFPTAPLTPPALAKWWDRLEPETERLQAVAAEAQEEERKKGRRGVNLQPRNGCVTCGSDMWVVVKHRPAAKPTSPEERGHEEVAPCPVCNTESRVMANFWDGRSWSYSQHPGEVIIS